MESGFTALATASATLFGLLMVPLVLSYRSAINSIQDVDELRHFLRWAWTAGFGVFLYYACCFLVSFRLMEDETSYPALAAIIAVTTLAIVACYIFELVWFSQMAKGKRGEFKGLFIVETLVILVVFFIFASLVSTALAQAETLAMVRWMRTAMIFTLCLASLRAVVLVGSCFWAIVIFHHDIRKPDLT